MISAPSARRGILLAAVAVLAAAAVACFPQIASAHALIGKQDLPLPQWLFIWGGLLILVVSFVGLLLGWRDTKLEGVGSKPLPAASKLLVNKPVEILCGLIGVALLVLVIATGLTGDVAPDRNFSITFIFVTFWIGMVLLSVLFGNVFRPLNPWRAIGRFVSAGFAKVAGQQAPAPFTYPEKLGRWPAVVGLVGFLFLELVWGQSGFTVAGITPQDAAIATVVYSVWTFGGMAMFGVDKWTERGEAFSVYFGMFASLAPLTVEDGELRSRRFLSGSTTWADQPGSLAMVLIAIGGTTYDGSQEGVLKDPIESTFTWFNDLGLSQFAALRITDSLFLLLCLGAVALIFWAGIYGMRIVERERSAGELGRAFAHAFIPIALAYVIAHYFSYFVYLEQAQFTFLLSDPFGTGADLFGTAGSGIDYNVIDANTIWYVQCGSIVIGHVIALALGHDRALKIWGNTRDAAWSQVWMLVMMMFFSMLGLYLLSQSNG